MKQWTNQLFTIIVNKMSNRPYLIQFYRFDVNKI